MTRLEPVVNGISWFKVFSFLSSTPLADPLRLAARPGHQPPILPLPELYAGIS